MTSKNYIAIDIAKDTLAVHCEAFAGSFEYNTKGLKKLLEKIHDLNDPQVVCEASGGYERQLMELLHSSNIAVSRISPTRVRAFAHSDGIKAKTDPIDAALLLRFAQNKNLKPTPPPSTQKQILEALMDRRSQLTESLAREKNRWEKAQQYTRNSIEKMMDLLEEEITSIDKQIRENIAKDQLMKKQSSQMQMVKGVGETTAWSILAYLGEITSLNRNQLIALAGLAPYAKDSGKFKGKRRIEGGRAKVRKCLYMAATSAAVHNPHIKAYVDGLRARGKPYKCAIVAAMRKLLIHLQSLLKNQKKCLA